MKSFRGGKKLTPNSKTAKVISFLLISLIVLIVLFLVAKVLFFIGLLVLLGIAIAWAWKEYKSQKQVTSEEKSPFLGM